MRQFFILSALCVGMAALTPAHAGEKVWISLGDAALAQLQKHRPAARAVASVQADAAQDGSALAAASASASARAVRNEGLHLVEVDEDVLASLSHSIHEELKRCGGYMYHPTREAGLASLQRHSTPVGAQRPSPQSHDALVPQGDDGGVTATFVRIGVEAAVGSLSLDGENLGFALAFEEANAAGGVHGRRFVWTARKRASGAPADVLDHGVVGASEGEGAEAGQDKAEFSIVGHAPFIQPGVVRVNLNRARPDRCGVMFSQA